MLARWMCERISYPRTPKGSDTITLKGKDQDETRREGTMPLIGMSLLQGFVETMDTRPGGGVLIETTTEPIS